MLTLAQMNPCGLSSISGETGCGKTTVLGALIAEVGTEPLFVIDLEQGREDNLRPDALYLKDISTFSQLNDVVVFAPTGSIFFIDGIQFLDCPGTLLESLADLWAACKERKLRIIFTFQVRRPPVGDCLGRAVQEVPGPTLFGVTDGFMFSLSESTVSSPSSET